MGKKKVIKKFETLPADILAMVKIAYPDGFEDNIISFQTATGELALGIPLATDEVDYLIKLPTNAIPDMDDDDDSGSSSSQSDDKEFVNLENLEIADDSSSEED